jgi:hypothetical protein
VCAILHHFGLLKTVHRLLQFVRLLQWGSCSAASGALNKAELTTLQNGDIYWFCYALKCTLCEVNIIGLPVDVTTLERSCFMISAIYINIQTTNEAFSLQFDSWPGQGVLG